MKLKNNSTKNKKLVTLKLIKTKVYTKNKTNNIKNDDIFVRLRKGLHIIYKFALSNKKILFIGAPAYFTNQFKKLIKTNRYSFIPDYLWFDGLLTNRPTNRTDISLYLLRIAQESDFMVVLDSISHNNSLNEGYVCDIPTISLNCNLNILDERIDYKIPGEFKFGGNKIKNNFFSSILYSIIKKSINVRLKYIADKKKEKERNDYTRFLKPGYAEEQIAKKKERKKALKELNRELYRLGVPHVGKYMEARRRQCYKTFVQSVSRKLKIRTIHFKKNELVVKKKKSS